MLSACADRWASPARCPPSCSRLAPTRICCCGSLTPEQCTCSFPDGRGAVGSPRCARDWPGSCAPTPSSSPDGDLEAIAAAVRRRRSRRSLDALGRVAARAPAGAPVIAVGVGAVPGPRRGGALRPDGPSGCRFAARRGRPARSRPRSRFRSSAVSELGPLVVKVGGGLLAAEGLDGLRRGCAEVLELARDRPVLVVPGGGPFADAVRALDAQVGLGDDVAHVLALRAMDQLGVLLAPMLPGRGAARRLGGAPRASVCCCGARVRGATRDTGFMGGDERLARGARGRRDRGRGGDPAQAGRRRGGRRLRPRGGAPHRGRGDGASPGRPLARITAGNDQSLAMRSTQT